MHQKVSRDLLKKTVQLGRLDVPDDGAIHIAYGIDENFVMPAGVSSLSILENNRESQFVVHIMMEEISDASMAKLRSLTDTYDHVTIYLHFIDAEVFDGFRTDKSYPYPTYYRLVMPDILRTYTSRYIYTDADVVCLGSVVPLWELDLEGKIAAVFGRESDAKPSIGVHHSYFSPGMMLIDADNWMEEGITETTLALLREHARDKNFAFDMDALNVALYEKVYLLDRTYHYIPHYKTEPDIAHPTMFLHYPEGKPWTKWFKYPLKKYWLRYMDMSPWAGELTDPINYQQEKYMGLHLLKQGKILAAFPHFVRYCTRKVKEKYLR